MTPADRERLVKLAEAAAGTADRERLAKLAEEAAAAARDLRPGERGSSDRHLRMLAAFAAYQKAIAPDVALRLLRDLTTQEAEIERLRGHLRGVCDLAVWLTGSLSTNTPEAAAYWESQRDTVLKPAIAALTPESKATR